MTFTDVGQAATGAGLPTALPATAAPTTGQRLRRAKRAHTARHIPLHALVGLRPLPGEPLLPGDLVLAQVQRLGRLGQLEDALGRRRNLFVGDELLLTWYGSRVTDAHTLRGAQLLQPSGLAGLRTPAPPQTPTELKLLGRVADAHGQPVALTDRARLHLPEGSWPHPVTLAVVGLGRGCGKTTAAAHLVRGLARQGLRVGAAKLNGQGSCAETALLADAGASQVLDHTDAGRACTDGLEADGLEHVGQSLLAQLAVGRPDVVVLDLAEGLQHGPSADLVAGDWWASQVDGLLLCAGDAAGAIEAADWLAPLGVPLLAVSGTLTGTPGLQGVPRHLHGLALLGPAQLASPEVAMNLCRQALQAQVHPPPAAA